MRECFWGILSSRPAFANASTVAEASTVAQKLWQTSGWTGWQAGNPRFNPMDGRERFTILTPPWAQKKGALEDKMKIFAFSLRDLPKSCVCAYVRSTASLVNCRRGQKNERFFERNLKKLRISRCTVRGGVFPLRIAMANHKINK